MAGELAFYTMVALFVLIVVWRRNKQRQKPESKTPYDYALTNARADNKRYRDELVTIQALKRTEADTERIRNEIGTILSDDGEKATDDVYDSDSIHRELEAVMKRWESDMKELTGGWDIPDVIKTTDDNRLAEESEERSLINDIKDKASENLELAVEFAKMTVQDDEAIRKQLEETSKELAEEIRDVRRRMREFREEGKYYGETLYRKGNR